MSDPASLDRLLRKARRWMLLSSVAFTVVISAIIVPLWIREPPPPDLYGFGGVLFYFLFPAFLFVLALLAPRSMRRRLEKIWPRVREAGMSWVAGLVLVLDNGLFVQSGRMIFITAFYTSGGSQIVPAIKDAKRWTRPFRWKREALMHSWRRRDDGELGAIRKTLGVSIAHSVVAAYTSRAFEAAPPARMVSVALAAMFPSSSILDRVVAESGRIATYLEGLVRGRLGSVAPRS